MPQLPSQVVGATNLVKMLTQRSQCEVVRKPCVREMRFARGALVIPLWDGRLASRTKAFMHP